MTAGRVAQCLLLVDLQRAFVEGDRAVPAAETLMRAAGEQLERARAAGALVVHLQNDGEEGTPDAPGGEGWELALTPAGGEAVLRKANDSGFDATELGRLLESAGVASISVCGVMSEMCVAATARDAMALGHVVVLARDSHATYDVPPFEPGGPGVPAELAARAAEWSLGDRVLIAASAGDVRFAAPIPG